MKNKYLFVVVMLLTIMIASVGLTNIYVYLEKSTPEKQAFHVVTSFYPMYIAAKNIIGDCEGVTLQNLSEPQTGCMHDYQLTPVDMKVLSDADAFIINGGGIENFLSDVAAQYPQLALIDACAQVELLEDNAHAWMSISDHMIQVQTIADKLSVLDVAHKTVYQENLAVYLSQLESLRKKQQEVVQNLPVQNIVIFHEAFDYIARDYGLVVSGRMDLDEERQVSAGEVADMVAQIREHDVHLILAEELYGAQMCDTIKKETAVDVIYLDTCVRGTYEADSYLRAMGENLELIRQALLNLTVPAVTGEKA